MKTFKSTGKFRKEGDYEIRDLDEICGNCDEILGRHKAFGENCPEQEKKQDVQTSDSSVPPVLKFQDGFKISFMENNLMTRGTAVILIHPDDAEIVKQHYSNK